MNLKETYPETVRELKDNFSNPELPKPVIELSELEKLCEGDLILEGLLSEVVDYCERYTETVAQYQEFDSRENTRENQEEKAKFDKEKRVVHNATIDSINILARALIKSGKNGQWIESLHGSTGSRATYATFALRTTYQRLIEMEVLENGKEDNGQI